MLARESGNLRTGLVGDNDAAIAADGAHAEEYVDRLEIRVPVDVLRHGVADQIAVFQLNRIVRCGALTAAISGGGAACAGGLRGDKVDQIMYVQHIAAGKHARQGGLHVFKDDRAVGARIHLDVCAARQLVFRNQADRQQHGIAVEGHFGARNRAAVGADLGDDDALDTVAALNVGNRMGQIKRDVKVVQALHDIARQAARIGHDLDAGEHLGALERHAARHNQADIARTENEHALADHVTLDIQITLRGAGGEHARRTGAGNRDGAAGAFTAAHCQHDGLCLQHFIAARRGDDVDLLVGRDVKHHCVQPDVHAGLADHVDEAAGVFRAGQLFVEVMQAEAAVDALIEDTAQLTVALDDANRAAAVLPRGLCRAQAGRAAANDDKIVIHACSPPLVTPVRI